MPEEAEQQQRLLGDARAPRTGRRTAAVCDRPSKMIDDTPSATSVTSAAVQPGSSRPLPKERRCDAPVLVDQRQWASRPSSPEPDRERLAVRAPFVAPELGHHRQRQRGVADEHDEQRRRRRPRRRARARRRTRSPIDRRPAPERAPGSRRSAQPWTCSARRSAAPRSWSVENGSRNCQAGPMIAQTMASPTQP